MLRRPASLVLAVLIAGSLSACIAAPSPEPRPTRSPTASPPAPSPSDTPTPVALTVGAGDEPPTVFGGDCAAVLSAAEVGAIVGVDVEPARSESIGSVGNVGGLTCRWRGEAGSVVIGILPVAAIGPVELTPGEVSYYFEDCSPDWVCGWRMQTEDLWIATTFQLSTGMTRAGVDAWGAQLGEQIAQRSAASTPQDWVRDRTGWWPDLDCVRMAGQLGAALGTTVTGQSSGYVDPPLVEVLVAGIESRTTHCYLTVEESGRAVEVTTRAGEAWTLPYSPDAAIHETGVPGITAYRSSGLPHTAMASFALTEGVNLADVHIHVPESAPVDEIVHALAVLAASGWN